MQSHEVVSAKNRTTVRFDALQLGAVRLGVQLASRVAPGWVEAEAARLFLTPRRSSDYPEPQLAGGVRPEQLELRSGSHRLAAYVWGRGEPVLLVHGWEGRAGQFTPIAERLVGRGFQAVAVDLPAHGRSSGKESSIIAFAQAIADLSRELGTFKAVISHSLGGAATGMIASEQRIAERLVFIAPAAESRLFVQRAAKLVGLPQSRVPGMCRQIELRVGRQLDETDLGLRAGRVDAPLLVLHDEDDREVPVEHGRIVAALSRQGQLEVVRGHGHRRILKSPEIVGRAVDFAVGAAH